MKISTGLANALLAEKSLKAALDGGELRLFSGAVPASADDAVGSAVLLGVYKASGAGINFEAAADNGALSKAASETWAGMAVATGTASFLRHVLPADDNNSSTTAIRIQATVALAGADIDMTTLSVTQSAALQPMEYYTVVMPKG